MNLRRRNRITSEVNASSLNDIMFFLLLFFLITSTLVNPNVIKVLLPKHTGKGVVQSKVTVSIDAESHFYLNRVPITEERLLPALEAELKNQAEPVIMLNADGRVPFDEIVKVMAAGQKLNAKVIARTQKE